METLKQTVSAQRLDAVAQNVAVLLAFLLPILFLPTSWVPFAHWKVALLALTSLVPLTLWTIARFKEKAIMYPNSYVLWSALLLPLAYFASALLSGGVANGMVGTGYENDTLMFIVILVALFATITLVFTSIASVARMLLAISSSFAVLAFLQVVRLIFGAENILPSIFSSNPTVTLLGSWNDLAVFSGLIVIMSLVALMYAPRTRIMQALTYINLAMAIFLLVVVNLKVVWIMLGLMSLILFVYFIAVKSSNEHTLEENESNKNKKDEIIKMIAPITVFVLSVLFMFAGGFLGPKVNTLLNVQFVDVRPSWEGTIEVAKNSYSESAILGTGPNTFARAWEKYKPTGVNNTNFWNINFRSGIGLIPTAFITVGLVGGLLWIFFLASVVYTAFKVLWARMSNDIIRFVVFATVGGSLYLLVLLTVYVPQTVMLGFTFLMVGLFLAVARNINVVNTRKISVNDNSATSFVLMLTLVTTTLVLVSVFMATTQKVLAASLLQRSTQSAQNKDYERAKTLAERARESNLWGIFGNDDRASSILAQLGIIKLREVVQTDPKSEGYRENLQKAIEGVILPARAALETNPNNYNNHVFLGNIYEQLSPLGIDGAYEAALTSYRAARELNPTDPSIPLRMARAAFGADKSEDAKKFAEESLALKRNYTDAYYLLSQIAIKDGNVEQAIATTESAAILAPNNPGILFQLGVLQYSTKEYKKAAQIFARAINLNPNYANALYYLGLSTAQLGDNKTALAAFKRVAKLNPENEDIKKIVTSLESGQLQTPKAPEASAITPVSETSQ